jgi:acyl-coenzyme A thioesterase PaaI-like protein
VTAVDEATKRASARLAEQMRRIIARLAVVRPGADELDRAAEVAEGFADRLDELPERTRSWEISEAGLLPRDFVAFSPVSGRNNPIAPPVVLRVESDEGGRPSIVGEVSFGAAYEGPPGHCHGGWIAAVFDEALGFAQLAPGFTAYLHVNYRRPTPLHQPLTVRAWVDNVDGRKRLVKGELRHGDDVLADAEGLFIAPRGDGDYLARLGMTP